MKVQKITKKEKLNNFMLYSRHIFPATITDCSYNVTQQLYCLFYDFDTTIESENREGRKVPSTTFCISKTNFFNCNDL